MLVIIKKKHIFKCITACGHFKQHTAITNILHYITLSFWTVSLPVYRPNILISYYCSFKHLNQSPGSYVRTQVWDICTNNGKYKDIRTTFWHLNVWALEWFAIVHWYDWGLLSSKANFPLVMYLFTVYSLLNQCLDYWNKCLGTI